MTSSYGFGGIAVIIKKNLKIFFIGVKRHIKLKNMYT